MILSYILAVRNTTPETLTAALPTRLFRRVEEANGWCWAHIPKLDPGMSSPLQNLESLEGPCLLVTEESARRWQLHFRKRAEEPFDTIHVYHWIEREPGSIYPADDEEDLFVEMRAPTLIELANFYFVPRSSLTPLAFFDTRFDVYQEERDQILQPFVADYILSTYQKYETPLPPSLAATLVTLPNDEAYQGFLAFHAAHIADALERFEIPHDRSEVLRTLTGKNLMHGELEQLSGNLLRFLRHLGLSPLIEEKLMGHKKLRVELREDPAEDAIKFAGGLQLQAIQGGPVFVPLEDVFLLARCAMYQDHKSEYVVRVGSDVTMERPQLWLPPFAYFRSTPSGAYLFIGAGVHICNVKMRKRIGKLLQHVPDGACLELLMSGPQVCLRFFGRVEGDRWRLESASVPLSSGDIDELLALFRVAEARQPQHAKSEIEMNAILLAAVGDSVFYEYPPWRDGLVLYPREPAEAESLGQLLFLDRFAHRWDFSEFKRRQAEFLKRCKQFHAQTAWESAPPASKRLVFDGEASRYFEADYDAKVKNREMRKAARDFKPEDRAMADLGFACVGAAVCERAASGIRRCYANPAERSFAYFHAQTMGTTWHDFYTQFDDATLLITTTGTYEGSFRSLRILVQSRPGLTLRELHAEHIKGIASLKDRGLIETSLDASLQGACRAMDEYLMRRLGPRSAA